MVTKRFLKNVIVAMVSVFMSLTVFQGVQAQQTGFGYQRQQRIVECVTLLVKSQKPFGESFLSFELCTQFDNSGQMYNHVDLLTLRRNIYA